MEMKNGILLPMQTKQEEPRKLPVKSGWCVDRTIEHEMSPQDALEVLYTSTLGRGTGGIELSHATTALEMNQRQYFRAMLDELAVKILGGVPEEFIEYT